MSCEKLWPILSRVTKVQHQKECRRIPPLSERVLSFGEVSVQNKEGSLIFFERNRWVPSNKPFTNVFYWKYQQKQNRISFERMEFGRKEPVFLFHLTPVEPSLFKTVKLYECGEELYKASLLFDIHYIHLQWHIFSAKKNQVFNSCYFL